MYIDSRTFHRIDINDIHENVKFATALIIEKMDKIEKQIDEIGNLKSQNIEGWSETYSTHEELQDNLKEFKQRIIKTYLTSVIGKDNQPLLYCGVL